MVRVRDAMQSPIIHCDSPTADISALAPMKNVANCDTEGREVGKMDQVTSGKDWLKGGHGVPIQNRHLSVGCSVLARRAQVANVLEAGGN
ncbi:hypothetical protein NL676_007211 [Syzygium grande]|nr:hypothetical protein NL676_007211 [Syzygium grande]